MDLATFIEETLKGIAAGVRRANTVTADGVEKHSHGPFSLDPNTGGKVTTIDFDVAVAARTEGGGEVEAGGKISVLGLGAIGAGGKGEFSAAHERTSRIRFAVRVNGNLT